MFFFVLLINMMRFVSQTTFRQFPSLLLNGTCGSRLWPPSGECGSRAPRLDAAGGRGGRAGRQTDKAAGSWAAGSRRYVLPAVCPSPSSPAPVGSGGLAVRCLPWTQPHPLGQPRDPWLTASGGPRRGQDVVVVAVVLVGRGRPRLGGRRPGLLLLLHVAAQGQDAVVQGRIQLARVLGAGLVEAEGRARLQGLTGRPLLR